MQRSLWMLQAVLLAESSEVGGLRDEREGERSSNGGEWGLERHRPGEAPDT